MIQLSDAEVQVLLEELVGPEGLEVVRVLEGKIATDGELAEETGLPMQRVRAILNTLNSLRLTEYMRVGKGRMEFTYLWRLSLQKLPEFIQLRKREKLGELRRQLEYEERNAFYLCPGDRTRVPFDEAFGLEFRCPRCQGGLTYVDNKRMVKGLKARIEELEGLAAEG